MSAAYQEFLARKQQDGNRSGFTPVWMPDFLFDFQQSVVEWNLLTGKSAAFLDWFLDRFMELTNGRPPL